MIKPQFKMLNKPSIKIKNQPIIIPQNKKEEELDQIYKANLHGRHKRKIQALLSEQV